jgi:hypothetical protein
MPNMKPSFDGKGMYSQFYDGPPPTPGPYRGVIKGMWLGKVASGDNEGADKILIRTEINHGKYKGASLLTNLTLIKNSAWTINQFLHALTPAGTEKQKSVMEELFWDKGLKTSGEAEKLGDPIVSIGGKFKPVGKEVGFITKMDEYGGQTRAIIDRFVVPLENSEGENEGETETVEESETVTADTPLEGLDEFAAGAEDSDSDDDDPWGDS